MRAIKETTILKSVEVKALAKLAQELLGPEFRELERGSHFDFETHLRLGSLAARCQQVRTRRSLTIKEVAAVLKVPQYRLKAVEAGLLREISPQVLRKYVSFLDLNSWAHRWAAANRRLAKQVGLVEAGAPARRARRRTGAAPDAER